VGKERKRKGMTSKALWRRSFAVKIDVKERGKKLDSRPHEMMKTNMEDSL